MIHDILHYLSLSPRPATCLRSPFQHLPAKAGTRANPNADAPPNTQFNAGEPLVIIPKAAKTSKLHRKEHFFITERHKIWPGRKSSPRTWRIKCAACRGFVTKDSREVEAGPVRK